MKSSKFMEREEYIVKLDVIEDTFEAVITGNWHTVANVVGIADAIFDMRHLDREHAVIIGANSKKPEIIVNLISIGGLASAPVSPHEVFKVPLLMDLDQFFFLHNHPFGEVEPSELDEKITVKLRNACLKLNIAFLDHIIVGEYKHFSFAESGILYRI